MAEEPTPLPLPLSEPSPTFANIDIPEWAQGETPARSISRNILANPSFTYPPGEGCDSCTRRNRICVVRTGYASCASCTALSRTRRLCRNTKSKRQGRGSSVTRALGEGQGEGMGNGGGPTTPGSATSDFSGLWPTTFLTNPLTSNPNEASRPNQPIFTNQPTYSVEALYEMLEAAESGGALGPLLRAIVRSIEELRENPQAQARGRIGL